ncbi:hypothetical protein JST97_19665 [bacterium]|nr:hypothetical protein [bacterium]
MRRRQFLAGLVFCLLGVSARAVPNPGLNDLRLEEQISLAQGLCVKAGRDYRDWFEGRKHSEPARQSIAGNLAGLAQFQNQAAQLAVPGAQASVRRWARTQKQELRFFLDDVVQNKQRPTQAELQQRWENAVAIQADLLETRQQQLAVVARATRSPELLDYYRWKSSILAVQKAELELAREVSGAFQQHRSLSGITGRALQVARKAEVLRAPAICERAQALYLERFTVLSRLCLAADQAIQSTNQDTVEELQDKEEIYRQKTLASDDASLAALRRLLSKNR